MKNKEFVVKQKMFFDRLVDLRKDDATKKFFSPFIEFYCSYNEKALKELINSASVSLLLDFGCGDGKYSIIAASDKDDIHIVGIDVSAQSIRKAQHKASLSIVKQKISFIVGDVRYLPFRRNVFDATFISYTLHHLPNFYPLDYLNEVMKSGGILVAIENVINNPFRLIGWKYWRFVPKAIKNDLFDIPVYERPIINLFTVNMLNTSLKKMGFNILREERHGLFIFVPIYISLIFPFIRYLLSNRILLALFRLERFFLMRTPAREFCYTVVSWAFRF